MFRWSIIVNHQLASANGQALDYDSELSIVNKTEKLFAFLQPNTVCFALKMLLHIVAMIDRSISLMETIARSIYIPNGVMAEIIPSSYGPFAEIFKMASGEPIMQSIIDWFD